MSEDLVEAATEDEQGRTSGNLVAGTAPVVPSAFQRDLLAMGRIVMQPTITENGTVLVPTWAQIPGEFESVTNEAGETTQVPVTYEDEFVEGVNNWLKERGMSTVNTGAEATDILRSPLLDGQADTIFSSIYEIAAMQYLSLIHI